VIVYLDARRQHVASIVGKLQHATAGIPLLALGMRNLREGEGTAIAVAEVVIAAGVLLTFVIELRATIRHIKDGGRRHHAKVGWFDLAAGLMLFYEAFHGEHHKAFYLRAAFVTGALTILLGLLHHRLSSAAQKKRYFKIDDGGIEYKMMFRGWSIPWDQLESVDLGGTKAVFALTDGRRHTLRLGGLLNSDAVRRAISDHPGAAKLLNVRQ
jgi:hypothetical protein